jgi:hypothetical protein
LAIITLIHEDTSYKEKCTKYKMSGYGLDDWGSRFQFLAGAGNFLFTTMSRTAVGPTQPLIQQVLGALSLGVKQLGHATDHSPPSSAKVKQASMELYLHSPIYLHGMVLN